MSHRAAKKKTNREAKVAHRAKIAEKKKARESEAARSVYPITRGSQTLQSRMRKVYTPMPRLLDRVERHAYEGALTLDECPNDGTLFCWPLYDMETKIMSRVVTENGSQFILDVEFIDSRIGPVFPGLKHRAEIGFRQPPVSKGSSGVSVFMPIRTDVGGNPHTTDTIAENMMESGYLTNPPAAIQGISGDPYLRQRWDIINKPITVYFTAECLQIETERGVLIVGPECEVLTRAGMIKAKDLVPIAEGDEDPPEHSFLVRMQRTLHPFDLASREENDVFLDRDSDGETFDDPRPSELFDWEGIESITCKIGTLVEYRGEHVDAVECNRFVVKMTHS